MECFLAYSKPLKVGTIFLVSVSLVASTAVFMLSGRFTPTHLCILHVLNISAKLYSHVVGFVFGFGDFFFPLRK